MPSYFSTYIKYTKLVLKGLPIETYMRKDDDIELKTRSSLKTDEKLLWMFHWFTYGTFKYITTCAKFEIFKLTSLFDKDKRHQDSILKKRAGLFFSSSSWTDQDIPYANNRLVNYNFPLALGISQNKALRNLCRFKSVLPDNKSLIKWIISSQQANTIKKQSGNWYVWGEDPFDYGMWLKNSRYYKYPYIAPDIVKFLFNIETFEIKLIDYKNNTYDNKSPLYEAAMIHTISLIGLAATIGGQHSWVHFHMPCIISESVKLVLNYDSVLYKILKVHTEYTSNTTNQAFWNPTATNWEPNNPTFTLPFDYKESILGGTYDGLIAQYDKVYGKHSNTDICFFERYSYESGDFDVNIPYHRFCMTYYTVIENFITEIVPYIDVNEFLKFEEYVKSKFVGRWFSPDKSCKYRIIKFLSSFIHNVTILHSADHYTFWIGASALAASIRLTSHIKDTDVNSVINNQYEIYHTQTFNNTFSYSHFNETSKMLLDINYKFNYKNLDELNHKFIENLKSTEKSLKENNLNLCPTACIFPSICA